MRGTGEAIPVCRLLLVDADDTARQWLARRLTPSEDLDIEHAESATDALTLLLRKRFDAVLLDGMLPDMGAADFCRRARRQGMHAPILVLGPDSDLDEVSALDGGANDYILRPPSVPVLLARLRAHLRQHEECDDAAFAIGAYVFQPTMKLLTRAADGSRLRVTHMEAAILRHLRRAKGMVVPRQLLLSSVWAYNDRARTHTVETHIYRLRRKLERDPRKPEVLVTEAGGYRLFTSPPSPPSELAASARAQNARRLPGASPGASGA